MASPIEKLMPQRTDPLIFNDVSIAETRKGHIAGVWLLRHSQPTRDSNGHIAGFKWGNKTLKSHCDPKPERFSFGSLPNNGYMNWIKSFYLLLWQNMILCCFIFRVSMKYEIHLFCKKRNEKKMHEAESLRD